MHSRISLLAAVATALTTTPAIAKEYILTMNAPMQGVSDGLFDTLKILPLDAFDVGGVHYLVLDAPNDISVETLFSVYGTWPISMSTISTDWDTFQAMPAEQKMLNLTPVYCRFCLG